MLAGLQGLHPFIHSGPPNVKSNHHRHPREKHTHTYGRSCPSFCFCLREMKVCFKWMSPRSCRVAIIPKQTMRGRQSISKEKLTRKEKQAFHSHIGSYWERSEETILTYTKKGLYTRCNSSIAECHQPTFHNQNDERQDTRLAVSKCADVQPTVTLSYTKLWTKCKTALKYKTF